MQAIGPFSPLAASSPNEPRTHRNMATATSSTAISPTSPRSFIPVSPTVSDAGSTMSLPDEMVRYRNQPYVAPEKLQIVKPLEGSMTLLKWKLLASPQLGGATTFFSDAKRPGVHLKKTGLTEKHAPGMMHLSPDAKIKSLSVNDLSVLSTNSPSTGRRRTSHQRERTAHNKTSGLTLSVSSADKGSGMNNISGLLPSPSPLREEEEEERERTKSSDIAQDRQRLSVSQGEASKESPQSSSFLGSLFGSGWTRLGLNRSKAQPRGKDVPDHGQIPPAGSTEVGLAGLL